MSVRYIRTARNKRSSNSNSSSSCQKSTKQQPLQRVHAYLTEKIGTNGMGVIYSIVFINLYYSLCMLNTTGICILGSKYCYDGSKIHVAHIVEQYLPYQPRVQQESYICKLLNYFLKRMIYHRLKQLFLVVIKAPFW